METNKPTFEESYDEIVVLLEKKRGRWQFKASVMMDFEDIKIKILTHIWKKWDKYDPSKPLGAWVNTIIQHQLYNILRDCYLSTSPPCSKCPCNLGDGMCSMFGKYSLECTPYHAWYKSKKFRHDARLPLSLESKKNLDEAHNIPEASFDIEVAAIALHEKMRQYLTAADWEIYKRLYIEHKDEELVASELGFKSTEVGRINGYKRMRQVTKRATDIAKQILANEGIETLH